MSVLSDAIEAFLLRQMDNPAHEVQVRRGELAQMFGCAPSQINYVLTTRFTPEHGYLIESQRGGGGYIRIVRIVRSAPEQLSYLLNERVGDSISAGEAQILCRQLAERKAITAKDAQLMIAATSPAALSAPAPEA